MTERSDNNTAISINDMKVLHPDEWIVAKVTSWDKDGPTNGEYVFSDKDQDEAVRSLTEVKRENPGAKYDIFFGNLPTPAA